MHLPERLQRPVALLAPVAYLAAIFVQSSFELPPQPEGLPDNVDKVLHFLEYGILGFLLQRGVAVGLRKPQVAWWVVALAGAFYGLTDELHQFYVPGRTASWGDVAADAVGALAGAWLGATRLRSLNRSAQPLVAPVPRAPTGLDPPRLRRSSGTASRPRGVPEG